MSAERKLTPSSPDIVSEFEDTPEVDPFVVAQIRAQAFIDVGMVAKNDDGEIIANEKLLGGVVLDNMLKNHVVNSKRDLITKSVTKFEKYVEVFPEGPGASKLPTSLEEAEAQEQLMRAVWTLLNTGTSGFVQKNVADEGYVLCEGKVARTKINQETRKKEPTTELGRFVTGDRDLIMTYYTQPAGASFIRAARKLDAQLGMVASRRPELASSIARQLGVVVDQAVGAIPHANVKKVNELMAAPENHKETG